MAANHLPARAGRNLQPESAQIWDWIQTMTENEMASTSLYHLLHAD